MAREARGLTVRALAEAVGVAPATISKIEVGQLAVGERLGPLADALRYPPQFFEQPLRATPTTAAPYFRRRKSTSARSVRQLEALTNLAGHHVSQLLRGVDVTFDRQVSSVDLDAFDGDYSQAADALRSMLGIPFGPVGDLTAHLESAGVIVLHVDPPVTGFDGVSIWTSDGLGLILVSEHMPGDRQRFTLAHELAHLVFHHGWARPDPETDANEIASELLMPSAAIGTYLRGLTVPRALELKTVWGVSASALIRKAHSLGYISDRTQSRLYAHLRSLTGSVREPVDVPRETPATIDRVLDVYWNRVGSSVDELADQCTMTTDEFQRLFRVDPPAAATGNVVRIYFPRGGA